MSAADKAAQLAVLASETTAILNSVQDPAVFALPLLHLRSAHPASLVQYAPLLAGQTPRLGDRAISLLRAQAIKLVSAVCNEPEWSGDPLPARAEVLFISHFLDASQAASGREIYFGDLPEQLAQTGRSVAVAYINHSRHRWSALAPSWSSKVVPRVLLSRTLGPRRGAGLVDSLARAGTLAAHASSASPMGALLGAWSVLNATTPAAFSAIRIGQQISDLIAALRPRWLVTTFEGHGWERLAFQAAHASGPDVRCIGYHHTVLFPQSHALGARYGRGFDPDVVLTAGEVTAGWFRRQAVGQDIPVSALGSVRTPAGDEGNSTGTSCLVVPEGIISEAAILFRMAAEAARQDPELTFKIRLHPVLSRRAVIAHAPDLASLPANVLWSTSSLEADMKGSRTVLYRGSTAALTGVLAGLRPIYAHDAGDWASIDPLSEMGDWRLDAHSGVELAEALRADFAVAETLRSQMGDAGRAYCRTYFLPLSRQRFMALFENAAVQTNQMNHNGI
jgi:hypothetical protein